jgi:hypothetical protein
MKVLLLIIQRVVVIDVVMIVAAPTRHAGILILKNRIHAAVGGNKDGLLVRGPTQTNRHRA